MKELCLLIHIFTGILFRIYSKFLYIHKALSLIIALEYMDIELTKSRVDDINYIVVACIRLLFVLFPSPAVS